MAWLSIAGLVALPLMLVSILLPVALVVALQVWLCRRRNRWLGLILPGISLLFSLLLVLSVAAFGRMGGGTMTLEQNGEVIERTVTQSGMTTVYDGEGNVLEQYPEPDAQGSGTSLETALLVGGIFLVANIPTAVLGGIWLHYRNRLDFQDELRKMKIQDLG